MACVLYKGTEKVLVSPDALRSMLDQGWSTEAPESLDTPPTIEKFREFLNIHEELKRTQDAALTDRDDLIADMTKQNEQLSEDMEFLEGENIKLRNELQKAFDALEDLKKQSSNQPAQAETAPEVEESVEETKEISKPDFKKMKVNELREMAARKRIPNYQLMGRPQLIKALNHDFEFTNKG